MLEIIFIGVVFLLGMIVGMAIQDWSWHNILDEVNNEVWGPNCLKHKN